MFQRNFPSSTLLNHKLFAFHTFTLDLTQEQEEGRDIWVFSQNLRWTCISTENIRNFFVQRLNEHFSY